MERAENANMNSTTLTYLLIFMGVALCGYGQQAPAFSTNVLLDDLEASLRNGHKKSLRDLGSLLNRPGTGKRAQRILQQHTLFAPEEIDLSKKTTKEAFLQFYYDNESGIQFSELTNSFYLSPLESRKVRFEVKQLTFPNVNEQLSRFHEMAAHTHQAIAANDSPALIEQLRILADMPMEEARQFLIDVADQLRKPSTTSWPPEVYQQLNWSLAHCSRLKSLESVLGLLTEDRIRTEEALSSLAMISNIALPKKTPKRIVIREYKSYIDSLGSLDKIRMHGYYKLFHFQPSFFNNMVDYYGRVLCFAGERQWLIHNAVDDLLKTTHPRALFYLAALGFKNEHQFPSHRYNLEGAINVINRITHLEVGVENGSGQIGFSNNNFASYLWQVNYLTYWAIHYEEYEWDASRDKFVNKFQALEKIQHYERLFRRLNSRNDSVAMASFKQLTEGEPAEIVALANKYRQMFRSYNHKLPPFKYKYLEQLALLTQFCREQGIRYEPDNKLEKLLDKLQLTQQHSDRYHMENTIVQQLQPHDVTPLEYWACLNQDNKEVNFSIGRILDIYYSRHWPDLLADDEQLRLYLKKASLLKGIGVIGVCNNYLNKFDLNNPAVKKRLKAINQNETDQQIIDQVAQLLRFSESRLPSATADFLDRPLRYDKRDIKTLPPPTENELQQLVDLIKKEEDHNVIKKLFFYLRLHPSIDYVPYLFDIATENRVLVKRRGIEHTIGDNVTPILESIFNYTFPAEDESKLFDIRPWKTLWEKDKDHFREWPKRFFEQKMAFLAEHPTLSIEDINLITESPNYDTTYKQFCLQALQKVRPVKDIRSLSMTSKLSLHTDLDYFLDFDFSYKELDDIPKLFELDEPRVMLNYLIAKASNFKTEDKGSFYNNMFRHSWFATYINSGAADLAAVIYIRQVLEKYLNSSKYLSEYEEQVTTLHIAQLKTIGKPLEERLLATFDLQADVAAKAKIQETIISNISYEDINLVAKHFDVLSTTLGPEPWAFLHRDFGIPVFDLTDKEAYISFRKNLKEMTEYEFYSHYLTEFGIDFVDSKGAMNYEKIAAILRFDSVTPFVGGGGGKRDHYTFGIIKLLELSFGTRLGFHEKLNENQSFYTFSTAERSTAWIDFLAGKGLISMPVGQAPSFNRVVE